VYLKVYLFVFGTPGEEGRQAFPKSCRSAGICPSQSMQRPKCQKTLDSSSKDKRGRGVGEGFNALAPFKAGSARDRQLLGVQSNNRKRPRSAHNVHQQLAKMVINGRYCTSVPFHSPRRDSARSLCVWRCFARKGKRQRRRNGTRMDKGRMGLFWMGPFWGSWGKQKYESRVVAALASGGDVRSSLK